MKISQTDVGRLIGASLRNILLLSIASFLTNCTPPPSPQQLTRWVAPDIPDERLEDFRLTALLAEPSARRSMYNTDDPVAWLDDYWRRLDPTPVTPENEALSVYRQRAAFLLKKFPDVPFGEWPEPWGLFLRHGLPDSRGPERPPWQALNISHGSTRRAAEIWSLNYGSPWNFRFTFGISSQPVTSSFRRPPRKPPSLEKAWEHLEDPTSSASRKKNSLTYISWYELPEVAERLLQIPTERFAGIEDLRHVALRRLAVRSAYLLEQEEARRLAALIAAGGSPEGVLRRAASGRYSAQALRQDLDILQEMRVQLRQVERMPNRGPNIELWDDPEGLLRDLANRFPSSDRVTGWDWRGDLYLAYGHPAHMEARLRIVHYTWGSPEALGVGNTMLGWVETARIEDILGKFIDTAAEEVRTRQRKGATAASTLAGALRGDSGQRGSPSRKAMLEHLHVLAPPSVYQVGLPRNANRLRLTMDAVAFPTSGDSMEIQASFGLPTEDVRIRRVEGGYSMNLRSKMTLMDHEFRHIYSITRYRGYLIEGRPEIEDRFFLDTIRFRAIPGSYILYLSVEDPDTEMSGGALLSLDLAPYGTAELQVSPILLAMDIRPTEESGKFVRGGSRILPAPSRYLLYGQDLFFYYEISNIAESEFHDYVWNESYYIIPHSPDEGIIRISPEHDYRRLQPTVSRDMQIDLSSLEATYEGPLSLVVLVTDITSRQQAIGVTLFNLRSPYNR